MTSGRSALNATAYAVLDVNGIAPFDPAYDIFKRHEAYRIARARNRVAIPLHLGAKYLAIKVQIKAFK